VTVGIEIDRLTKNYGTFAAVSELSMTVRPGEIFALLGPNGAGKTTTIRMLMGMLQASAGSARICGLDCFAERATVMHHVGYLPDEPVFYDYLRGRELLRFVGEMHGMSRADIEQRGQPLIERLQLAEALDEYAVNYSKGMKKKLALIAALLHDPRVLILDEPTNGLDPFATRALHELLVELAAADKLVFYSTHVLEQAERLCKRVAILIRGKLAAIGEISDLRANLTEGGSLEDVFFAVAGEPNA
jgi:ABC-2 type transport system ATP-binding protein